MRRFFKINPSDIWTQIIVNFFVYVVLQVGGALTPLVLSLVAVYRLNPPAPIGWVWIGLAGGWSLSGIIAIVLFWNHTAKRYLRTQRLLNIISGADAEIYDTFTVVEEVVPTTEEVRLWITNLLMHMCHIVAYRAGVEKKGAVFFILIGEPGNQRFVAFAKFYGDGDTTVVYDAEHQPIQGSLAGQALREGVCKTLRDSRRPPSGIDWIPSSNPDRYPGRAAAPVQLASHVQDTNVGALCLDVAVPYKLNPEEQMIMSAFATKIASIWSLYQAYPETEGDTP